MSRRNKLQMGTRATRSWDTRRVAQALAGPGIDTRVWASYATVAVVGDDGEPNYEDPHAVHIGPEGVSVDVILDPSGIPMTVRYLGVAGGQAGSIQYPIAPGDELVVLIPDGEMGGAPVALPALSSSWAKMPLGPDGKPVFKNDRILVLARGTPIDVRAGDGGRILVNQDGEVDVTGSKVQLGDAAATEQALLGTTYRSNEATLDSAWGVFLTALSVYVAAIQPVVDAGNVLTPPMLAALANMQAALVTFEGGAATYLSTVTRTK